ncbi:hypothetical protein F2P81_015817 [Scophthalmus maximus]|uniref:Uncharacterized protein n=1 Tax=Scophthalmus maximus TaxID=52904 RepID=A0A6A4SLS0_SCOMX|nr:hypothetical protein F2P81_015817 [Scophthalmus maximus]
MQTRYLVSSFALLVSRKGGAIQVANPTMHLSPQSPLTVAVGNSLVSGGKPGGNLNFRKRGWDLLSLNNSLTERLINQQFDSSGHKCNCSLFGGLVPVRHDVAVQQQVGWISVFRYGGEDECRIMGEWKSFFQVHGEGERLSTRHPQRSERRASLRTLCSVTLQLEEERRHPSTHNPSCFAVNCCTVDPVDNRGTILLNKRSGDVTVVFSRYSVQQRLFDLRSEADYVQWYRRGIQTPDSSSFTLDFTSVTTGSCEALQSGWMVQQCLMVGRRFRPVLCSRHSSSCVCVSTWLLVLRVCELGNPTGFRAEPLLALTQSLTPRPRAAVVSVLCKVLKRQGKNFSVVVTFLCDEGSNGFDRLCVRSTRSRQSRELLSSDERGEEGEEEEEERAKEKLDSGAVEPRGRSLSTARQHEVENTESVLGGELGLGSPGAASPTKPAEIHPKKVRKVPPGLPSSESDGRFSTLKMNDGCGESETNQFKQVEKSRNINEQFINTLPLKTHSGAVFVFLSPVPDGDGEQSLNRGVCRFRFRFCGVVSRSGRGLLLPSAGSYSEEASDSGQVLTFRTASVLALIPSVVGEEF